jgi:small subunit ribosomal protein S21
MKNTRRPQESKPRGQNGKSRPPRELDFNTVFKRYKRDTKKSGAVQECQNRQHYVKPTEKRKLALEQAIKRERRRQAMDTLPIKF